MRFDQHILRNFSGFLINVFMKTFKMEEISMRFPVIAQQILKQLDNRNLTKCRTVGKILRSSIDENRLIWTRMIKSYIKRKKCTGKFRKSWKLVMKKVPVKYLEDLALTTQKLATGLEFTIVGLGYKIAPQHIVAACGSLSLYKFITEKTGEINPRYVIKTILNC